MLPRRLFAPADAAWTPRPADPQDVFFSQVVRTGARPAGEGRGAVGLFGIPFDGAVLGRPGAREGPGAIRAQMAKLKPWTLGRGELPREAFDWGDVALPEGGVLAAHGATEAAARAVLEAGQLPVALGGDHSLTFPLVKAHEGRLRRVGVVNLDAHLDVRDYEGLPNSGTSFGRLLASGLVPGANLVEVGLRDFANGGRYVEKARKAGATLFSADEWMAEPDAVLDHAVEVASRGADGVYLSVDLDVLDQAHAPGVSAPTPGGVDSGLLFRAVRRVAQRAPLVGADFMEVAPPLDRDGMTARAAAYAVMHLLAALR